MVWSFLELFTELDIGVMSLSSGFNDIYSVDLHFV